MSDWPAKWELLKELLETVVTESKTVIAKELRSSQDLQTQKVGLHIFNALKSTTLKAAIPHFYALKELLPNFNDSHVEIIFGRPFAAFREDESNCKADPDFTRRLNFNDIGKVFVSGDLMMGVYNPRTTFGGRGVPPHLLAYNMNTEKMEWGIPLTPTPTEVLSLNTCQGPVISGFRRMGPAGYYLNRVGESMTLQFNGEKKVRFIDPNTGETKSSILLPYEKRNEYHSIHLTPSGFGYQMAYNGKLVGGKIRDSKLTTDFEAETPSAIFFPLSTHVGFYNIFTNQLVLFGPSGKSVVIDCLSVYGEGDKLYLIERDSLRNNTSKLTVRTMKTDDHVVSDPEKSIILESADASIGSLCENGTLILFSTCDSKTSPIFVSLDSGEIVHSAYTAPSYAKQKINTASGELWSWDEISKEIWKISSEKAVFMGILESGRSTTLLHVDQHDHLYFVDSPF